MSALAYCVTDIVAVISADLIQRETCNPAGVGFLWIVEIRADPDSQVGYPSIPNLVTVNGWVQAEVAGTLSKWHMMLAASWILHWLSAYCFNTERYSPSRPPLQ